MDKQDMFDEIKILSKNLRALAKYVEGLEKHLGGVVRKDELENFLDDYDFDRLMTRIDKLEDRVDELVKRVELTHISKHVEHLESQIGEFAKKDEKLLGVVSENDLRKYTKIAKIAARVIEIAADGVAVIADKRQSGGDGEQPVEEKDKKEDTGEEKLDLSGLFKSVEKLVSGLTSSADTAKS